MTNEEKTQKIIDCQSFNELDKVLDEIGDVEGSRGIMYSPNQTRERIKMVRSGAFINMVTRGNGLRAKVAELMCFE